MVNIFGNPVYILIIVVNIVIIAAIALTLFETRLKKKADNTENAQEKIYINDLNVLKTSNQNEEAKLYALNGIAKNFFQTEYNIPPGKTYSELSKDFKKLKNKKGEKFAEQMLISYYTKERLSKNELKSLIDQLTSMIEESTKKPVQKLPEEQSEIKETFEQTLDKIKSLFNKEEQMSQQQKQQNLQSIKQKTIEKQVDEKSVQQKPKESQVQQKQPVKKEKKQYETSHQILQESKKENLLKEIESISQNQTKINGLIQDVYSNNGVRLVEKTVKTQTELYDLFQENPSIFNKFKEISNLIEQNNQKLNTLFNHVYNYSDRKNKKILDNMTREWERERKQNLRTYKNPFKIQIKESELLHKYFTKLHSITTNLIKEKEVL